MKEHSLFYTIGLVTVTALTMVACGKKNNDNENTAK